MNRNTKIIYLLASLAAFAYVLIRAVGMGVTFDEVWTIEEFVPQNVLHIINYTPCDANNHIVNTLLIKFFFAFGDHSLFIARLPNVLAFILYLYFAYKISNGLISGFIGLATFLLLVFNPFLLDFFSIARGYALSLAFEITSLYFLLAFFKTKNSRSALFALIWGGFAVISNFTLLNYWLVMLFLVNLLPLIYRKEFNFGKVLLNSALAAIPVVAIIYEPIRKLKKGGHLYYGGNTDFYSDTMASLTHSSMYLEENAHVFLVLNVFLATLFGALIWSAYRRRFVPLAAKNIVLYLLVLCICSVVLQHHLLGTLYLIDRTALFFYPLLILLLCLALREIQLQKLPSIVAGLVAIGFAVNFFQHANFHKTALWYFDSPTEEILEKLNRKGEQQNRVINLDFTWPFRSAIGYYAKPGKYPFLNIVHNKDNEQVIYSEADYYIYLSKPLEKVGYNASLQPIRSMGKTLVFSYPGESVYVYALAKPS